MRLLSIDPGSEMSSWIIYDVESQVVLDRGESANRDLAYSLGHYMEFGPPRVSRVVIENLMLHPPKGKNKQSAGFYVGKTVRDTLNWIGTFQGCAAHQHGFDNVFLLERQEEFRHLLGKPTGTDAELRQACIDLYGGKEKAIGKKAAPGPLYGIKRHCWSALSVALTWCEMNKEAKND